MKLENFDLNLLISFDALIRERNVSRAAEKLHISQPAMSNSLKRLREYLGDPLLVRTSTGMEPTEKALMLAPIIRQSLSLAQSALSPSDTFDAKASERTFRILVSDYIEGTLISALVKHFQRVAPNITLDILTLSDGSFSDLEKGSIDLAINRFDTIPQSFHQRSVWQDSFSCLLAANNPLAGDMTLTAYLEAAHLWVSKTGIGVGTGMSESSRRGWVDDELASLGYERDIRVYTRHYQNVPLLLQASNMVATIPTRVAMRYNNLPEWSIVEPPFNIEPIQITMVWSPVLQHNSAHRWLRDSLSECAAKL